MSKRGPPKGDDEPPPEPAPSGGAPGLLNTPIEPSPPGKYATPEERLAADRVISHHGEPNGDNDNETRSPEELMRRVQQTRDCRPPCHWFTA